MARYHYILTLQWSRPTGGLNVATSANYAYFADDVSEKQRFDEILTGSCRDLAAPLRLSSVLFYRLVPDPDREWTADAVEREKERISDAYGSIR